MRWKRLQHVGNSAIHRRAQVVAPTDDAGCPGLPQVALDGPGHNEAAMARIRADKVAGSDHEQPEGGGQESRSRRM